MCSICQGDQSQDACDNGDEQTKLYANKDKQLQV